MLDARNKIVFITQLLNDTYIVWHVVMLVLSVFIHSFSSLSYDRSKVSSKVSSFYTFISIP